MKYGLTILTLLGILILTACNKDESEPEYTPLEIKHQFKPETKLVKISELDNVTNYPQRLYIVNSIDEFPDNEHFNNNDLKLANIDFSQNTLLIGYQFITGTISSYNYKWGYNNWFEQYVFSTSFDRIKDSEYMAGEVDIATYLRSAILVGKFPTEARCTMTESVHER